MMQASRQRRHDLSRGVAFDYTPEEKVGEYVKATIGIEKQDIIGEENIGGESRPLTKKRKYTKKKKAE